MDFKQLKLVYEKLYALSLETSDLINEKKYSFITKNSDKKNHLINKLTQMMNSIKDEKIPPEITELKNKLIVKEKENIDILNKLKLSSKIELNNINKKLKLISAYNQNVQTSSLIDIQE